MAIHNRFPNMKKGLVFSHIPKTGGLSLRGALSRVAGKGFCPIVQSPFPVRIEIERVVEQAHSDDMDSFLVAGHVGVGLGRLLDRDTKYFTFVRDPIERTLSNFYHRKRQGMSLSLIDWIEAEPRFSYNLQTRFLSGFEFDCQQRGEWDADAFYGESGGTLSERVGEEHLTQCLEAMGKTVFVGLTERYNESILVFRRQFGWPLLKLWYVATNKGTNRPREEKLSPEELSALEAANTLDQRLYRESVASFEESWPQDLVPRLSTG